jgi:glyoxylase-like metal-dependent hydrolase (beta-lactamase superfamily II)
MWSRFDYRELESTPPKTLFERKMQLLVGNIKLELTHLGSAHTHGDILVHAPEKRILYTGDLLFVGGHPVPWHGSVDSWISICDHNPWYGRERDRSGVTAQLLKSCGTRDEGLFHSHSR